MVSTWVILKTLSIAFILHFVKEPPEEAEPPTEPEVDKFAENDPSFHEPEEDFSHLTGRVKARAQRNAKLRAPVYGANGYLKRPRQEPSLLIRERRSSIQDDEDDVRPEEPKQQTSIYGDMFSESIRGFREITRAENDAKHIMEYVQNWQKEQNDKAIKQAKDAIAAANANRLNLNNESPRSSKSSSPTHEQGRPKKGKKEKSEGKTTEKGTRFFFLIQKYFGGSNDMSQLALSFLYFGLLTLNYFIPPPPPPA